MEIRSDRLVLKELKQEDLGFIYKMAREPLVYLYESDEEPSEDQTYKKYGKKISRMEENPNKYLIFLVSVLPKGIPVGEIHVQLNWEEMREWELGYEVHPEFWNKGYASEAAILILKHSFENLKAHKVVGFCNANNDRSAKLMERIGMKREGILREVKLWHKEWSDEFIYSILEREFIANGEYAFIKVNSKENSSGGKD